MRYAIKVNHFSFRFARRCQLRRVAVAVSIAVAVAVAELSVRVTLAAPFTQKPNVPLPAQLLPLPLLLLLILPLALLDFAFLLFSFILLCSVLFSVKFFFFSACPLGTFNFWRSFVVIFLDMRYSILCTVYVCECACICSSVFDALAGLAKRLLLIFGAACFNLCAVCLYCRVLLVPIFNFFFLRSSFFPIF